MTSRARRTERRQRRFRHERGGRRDQASACGSLDPHRPIDALPLRIYNYAGSAYVELNRLAWAGALVLIVLIVLAVSLVRYVTSRGILKGAS